MIKYQLYLLQIENYELGRFWRLLFQKGYFRSKQPLRKSPVWTKKIQLIFGLSVVFDLTVFALILFLNFYAALIWLFFSLILAPFFYSFALIIIWPFDFLAKQLIVTKAQKIVLQNENLKIIGIAGSYGKTTMKEMLATILAEKYSVLAPPESVNTPVGIARFIINKSKKDTDILIVEMGEHYQGDIAYLCKITPPDIAVVTGINEAHAERLGEIENSVATIFEIVEHAKQNALILLNGDDDNIIKHYQEFSKNKKNVLYDSRRSSRNVEIIDDRFDSEKLSWSLNIKGFPKIEVPVLGKYIIGDIVAGVEIARSLNLTTDEITKGLRQIKPVIHRLQPIINPSNIVIIDDSYNSNPNGVQEAISTLKRFKNRRKIFITPGMVETGKESARLHKKIGEDLATVVNMVILIKNSVTPHIAEGLAKKNFPKSDIVWFETAQEAHSSLNKLLQRGDVVLFQNDWGDQYL